MENLINLIFYFLAL